VRANAPSRAPRKRPSRPRGARTVLHVLDATERVLVWEGLDGVTMKRVAAEARVSAATLYQYFATREALVAAWEERFWESLLQQFVGHATTVVAAGTPLRDAIYSAALGAADVIARLVR